MRISNKNGTAPEAVEEMTRIPRVRETHRPIVFKTKEYDSIGENGMFIESPQPSSEICTQKKMALVGYGQEIHMPGHASDIARAILYAIYGDVA
jgi:hypothetical protein